MAEMPDSHPEGSGRNPRGVGICAPNATAMGGDSCPGTQQLMEKVGERRNMTAALRRVESNKGSAGVDGRSVEGLRPYLREHWPRISEDLLEGVYKPAPVLTVEIPKPGARGCESSASRPGWTG